MSQILQLNFDRKSEQFLAIEYFPGVEYVTLTDWIDIVYSGGLYLKLTSDGALFLLEQNLLKKLKKALENELVLDESIKKDIGYMSIQNSQKNNRKNFKYEPIGGSMYPIWIGERYLLFSSHFKYQQHTWLYNDKDGNIIFEITPSYPWIYNDPEEGEVFEKYSDWMKSYKPYVKRQIAHETAERWVKQLEHLMETIRENDDRLTCRGPNCQMCKEEGVQLYKRSSPNACDHQSCYDKRLELLGKLKK